MGFFYIYCKLNLLYIAEKFGEVNRKIEKEILLQIIKVYLGCVLDQERILISFFTATD